MSIYKVKGFILGCDPELTKEVEYVEADTEKKAEEDFLWHRDGYGIISTTKMYDGNTFFTEEQAEAVKEEVSTILGNIFEDACERQEVTDAIIDEVLSDIAETSDWSNLGDDEYCISDVRFAITRVIRVKVTE